MTSRKYKTNALTTTNEGKERFLSEFPNYWPGLDQLHLAQPSSTAPNFVQTGKRKEVNGGNDFFFNHPSSYR